MNILVSNETITIVYVRGFLREFGELPRYTEGKVVADAFETLLGGAWEGGGWSAMRKWVLETFRPLAITVVAAQMLENEEQRYVNCLTFRSPSN